MRRNLLLEMQSTKYNMKWELFFKEWQLHLIEDFETFLKLMVKKLLWVNMKLRCQSIKLDPKEVWKYMHQIDRGKGELEMWTKVRPLCDFTERWRKKEYVLEYAEKILNKLTVFFPFIFSFLFQVASVWVVCAPILQFGKMMKKWLWKWCKRVKIGERKDQLVHK